MNKSLLLQCLLLATSTAAFGCDKESAPEASAKPQAANPDAKTPEAAPTVAAAEQAKADDHSACIYAAGEGEQHAGHGAGHGGEQGCPHGEAEPEPNGKSEGHFGAPFQLAEAKALAAAVPAPGTEAPKADAPVLVEGTVDAVCQKKGCWMVIKDGMVSARVLMKDHGFAVPMDARGKKAKVEGTLTARTFTPEQVKHLEQDAGKDPSKVEGERTEYVLTASGIQITS